MKKTQSRDDTTNTLTHNVDDDSTPSQHHHQDQSSPQTQIHRIGSVGQRFLRHFDYTFLLNRSNGGGGCTDTGGSGLSPAAEAYLRHYYSQQQQEQPVLRRRTTVDGTTCGRRARFPPLVDLVDMGVEDVERLARSFVVVEDDYDNEPGGVNREGGDEHGQQHQPHPQPHGPRLLHRQCSDPLIHHHLHHAEGEKDDTNHAERMDSASTATTPTQTSRWSAFSLPPIISHRHTTTATTSVGAEDGSRVTTFVASASATATLTETAVTVSATSFTATTTATLVDCDSADEEDEGPQQHRPPQRQQQQQERYDHVAISVESTSTLSTGDRNEINSGITPIVRDNPSGPYTHIFQQAPSLLPLPRPSFSLTTTANTLTNNTYNNCKDRIKTLPTQISSTSTSSVPRQDTHSSMYHHHNQPQRTTPSFVPSTDNHPQQQSSAAEAPSDTAARQGSRMQRFTRLEDLADLEDLTVRLPATTPPVSLNRVGITPTVNNHSHVHRPSGSGEQHNDFEHDHGNEQRREQDERTRQYIEAHTTFLNSADTEGSGYIPPRPSITTTAPEAGHSLPQRHYHDHHPLDDHSHASASASAPRTPLHYPSSLAEDEGYTVPGTPHSFLSSPSLGYYSHPSRPPSQTGYWLDQEASSLNLIMPSSAMFVKSREPTGEGDKLGFVKLMVAGQSRVWNSRLIQDMFRWDGVIANDFEDEFLQDPLLNESDAVATAVGGSGSEPGVLHSGQGGSGGGGVSSSNESSSFLEETPGHHRQRKQDHYYPHPHQTGVGVREAIVEHYASSMVLPAWARAGFEDQELHQEILVKNICIVDTPGYSAFNNPNRAMDLVISYLGLQFQTTNEFFSRSALSDDSLGRFLANNTTGAHSHVDACLYVIEGQLSEIDILFMQRLQPWVNLIPVLIPPSTHLQERERGAPQDGQEEEDVIMSTPTTTAETIASARLDLIRQLKEHEIHIYGIDLDGALSDPPNSTSSSSSPFTTADSPETDLASPPLLVLDGTNPLSPEFTSPPFIFHVPPSLMEDTGVGQLDRDVLQLDVVPKQKSQGPQDDEDDSDNGRNSTLLPTIPQHRASSALGVQEDLPDLGPLRRWVYVNHLAALRHHTTQKFLSWRRHLPSMLNLQSPMESSQDSGSYRQQQRRHYHSHGGQQPHQQSLNTFSSDYGPGSHRLALSTATHSPPPSISITHHNHHLQQQHLYNQKALPTDMLGDLRAQDQRRISEKVVRMLETQGQVFERILQERQVAWRQALEGMEREQRIEFLMQELRRWANEGPNSKEQSRELERGEQKQRRLNVQYREGSRDSEWGSAGGGTGVGLGLEVNGLAMGSAVAAAPAEPSLRDALFSEENGVDVSNSVRATTTSFSGRKNHKSKYAGGIDPRSTKKSRSSASSSKMSSTFGSSHGLEVDMQDGSGEGEEEDPLGLGLWMSRLFGAIGRGLVNVVVMVGMGSFATWVYTHFLEHRVTWIG